MLYPTVFNDNLFDNLFDFGFRFPDIDRKLYGHTASRMMRTDVRENDGTYEVSIDLPGFKKDEITLSLENGVLSVAAAKGLDKNEKDKEGKLIRQERYSGSMTRSFYVGDAITEEEVKAKFEDGVLKLTIPKKEEKETIPEKKRILIEE